MKSSVLLALLFAGIQAGAQTKESRVVVDASDPKTRINRNIYGHFSEHLGHCIYGGYWVGEDSPIPNTNGIRTRSTLSLTNWPIGLDLRA